MRFVRAVVQFQLPGYSLVLYWVQRKPFDLSPGGPPAERLAAKFFNGEAKDEDTQAWRRRRPRKHGVGGRDVSMA